MTEYDKNELAAEIGEEHVPEDDRIIARAFRISAMVAVAIAVLGLATWFVLTREPAPEVVQEAEAEQAQSLTAAVVVEPPHVTFTDITEAAGIRFRHTSGATGERLLPETMGGGVAFFDFDRDGDQDLLLVDSRSWPWDTDTPRGGHPVLYANRGDGHFDDVTAATGIGDIVLYGMGVAVGDFTGDGYPDMYLTAVGENRLLINRDGERFEDVTTRFGVAGDAKDWSSSAAFFDADNDGDLDLYVANYVEWSKDIDDRINYRLTGIGRAYGPPTDYAGSFSRLFRNDGDTFTDISKAAGIQVTNPATGLPAAKSLAVLPIDVDEDGWTDLIVANDTVQNFFFHNQGDGTFAESGMVTGLAFDNTGNATGAMGLDAASFTDRDQIAVAVGNFANEMTSFYVTRRREALFSDQAVVSGIGPGSRQALSFGLFFFDFDLDGRQDLLQTNGHVEDEINVVQPSQHYEQPTQLFWNCGDACGRPFVQMEDAVLGDLARPVVGRGAAYADIDGDGDLDVVITQVNRRPLLLRNDQDLGHHWLRVRLEGPESNRDALGAKLRLEAGGTVQERIVVASRSYLSQVELPATFGLGDMETVDKLTVTWPDGSKKILEHITSDQLVTITY